MAVFGFFLVALIWLAVIGGLIDTARLACRHA